jgi:hypothetical protein
MKSALHCAAWSLGEVGMLKLIIRTMLTSTTGFAWDLIRSGARIVEASGNWGANDLRTDFAERSVWRAGITIAHAGESLELFVNACAMKLGYRDGEVAGFVAWPALAHG